jgi:hypothetical protein
MSIGVVYIFSLSLSIYMCVCVCVRVRVRVCVPISTECIFMHKVSVSKARAIVVLAEEGNADQVSSSDQVILLCGLEALPYIMTPLLQSDARALRTVLSLTGVKEGLRGHIVVELSDLDNEVLVKLVGGDLVETVVAHDVIGRLMIQCARQPGLAQVPSNQKQIVNTVTLSREPF